MRKLVLACLILAGCTSEESGGNQAAGAGASGGRAGTGRISTLTGLYEGGAGDRKDQLCMVEGEGGQARFGLVVWGSEMHSCSGSGTAVREGDRLRLAMAGDEACTLTASIAGAAITLPAAIPDGCAYYCGARATLEGASFTQAGSTAGDAAKAEDLVGEPLCGGGD